LYDIITTKNKEAFSYYISQSSKDDDITEWIEENPDKMNNLNEFINKHIK
jgi:hypothetical protein